MTPTTSIKWTELEAGKRIREQKTVSLNIDTGAQIGNKNSQMLSNVRTTAVVALQLEPLESLDDIDEEDVLDVQLDQAAKIVTDMATMLEVDQAPAQTAQVLR